jgi:choline dehydrogenase
MNEGRLMVLPMHVPVVSDEIRAQYPIPPNAFVIFPALVRPRSRGYLRMRTAEHTGPLEIRPNFLAEQAVSRRRKGKAPQL